MLQEDFPPCLRSAEFFDLLDDMEDVALALLR